MYVDLTPENEYGFAREAWTVALVAENDSQMRFREVHFGIFGTPSEARTAMESGLVTCREDEHLELRRIRAFPTN